MRYLKCKLVLAAVLIAAASWGVRASVVYNGASASAVTGPYSVTAILTANQSTNTATLTNLSGFTVLFDNGTFYSAGSPTRFTIPATGRYLIHGAICYDASVLGNRFVRIHKNGTNQLTAAISPPAIGGSDVTLCGGTEILSLATSDYIELVAYQDSGGNLNALGSGAVTSNSSYISITYLPGQ